jgi:alpha-L-rhamnosidase
MRKDSCNYPNSNLFYGFLPAHPGMVTEAYRILFNEECPGWLYAVNMGATTIWERWNSLLPDGTISGTGMNSLNHYAYGSVCEAIYSRIAGLQCGEAGWRSAIVKPCLNYRLKNINIGYKSPCGIYRVGWKIKEKEIVLKVTIPHGTRAQIFLPSHPNNKIIIVEEGNHEYCYVPAFDFHHPFSKNTIIMDLLANNQARQVLQDTLPKICAVAMEENEEYKLWTPQQFADSMFDVQIQAINTADEQLKKIRV